MLIARSRPPTICTSPTPGARSSGTLTILSAISVSSRIESWPDSAIDRLGSRSLSCFMIIGGSMSSGSRRTTDCTRSRTSWAATSMLRSRLNVMFSIDWPGADTERSSLMPSTLLTASSRMSESWLSTSSTDPPGREVRTITLGRSTDGKRSTPRRMNDAAPMTTSAMISIVAKTGRRMQMAASVFMVLLRDRDQRAVGEAARRDDHVVAGRDAFEDLNAIADSNAGTDTLFVRLAVFDDEHLLDAGEHHQCALRHHQARVFGGDDFR